MEYTIFILMLPLLTFIVLGLFGKKLKVCTAGLIGTISLGLWRYSPTFTAFQYFTTQKIDGVYQALTPFNTTWLNVVPIWILIWEFSWSYFGDDAGGYFHRIAHGAYIQYGLYEGRSWFWALLCFPFAFLLRHAGTGAGYQHFPDVYFLGTGRCFLLFINRFYYTKPSAVAAKKAFIVTVLPIYSSSLVFCTFVLLHRHSTLTP